MKITIPEWAFEFQGHRCLCMPLGYRAGLYALKLLGQDREKDYKTFFFSELSEEDSSGCFDDGVQIASGATYGKGLYKRLGYGKLAVTAYKAGLGSARVHVRNDFLENLTGNVAVKFLELRGKGTDPSEMPREVVDPIIDFILSQPDETIFESQIDKNFVYKPTRKAMTRRKCTQCGEYTFEAEGFAMGKDFFCAPCYHGIKVPDKA